MPVPIAPIAWLPLPNLGLICASGSEARSFLQGQLTHDAALLTPQQGQLSGYCSPKGRLLAVFTVAMPEADTFYLSLPAPLVAPTLKRLKLFVLRSKLVLEDASATLPASGLLGEGAVAALQQLGLPAPETPYATASAQGITVQRLAGALPRFLLRGDARALASLPQAREEDWAAAEVTAGTPQVQAETLDLFVPQTIDLDLAGGLSFTKGCYPGQEIVARVHYLGRLKARLHRSSCEFPALPGTAVYAADGDGQSVGEVVFATAPGLLLTLKLTHTGSTQLRLGTPDGPALAPPELVHPALP